MEGTQERTQETRRDTWEALGRMAAQLDLHHDWSKLRERFDRMHLPSGWAARIVDGYLDAELEAGECMRAYHMMHDEWAGRLIHHKQEKERKALEGIVSRHYTEGERKRAEENVPSTFEGILKIIEQMAGKGYPHLMELGEAAEQNNPDLALFIYDSLHESPSAEAAVEKVAMKVFDTNPELAFQYLTESRNKAACIERLLNKAQPTSEDYETVRWAMGKNCYETEAQMLEMYKRMAEGAITINPEAALHGAHMLHALLYDHGGRLPPKTKEQIQMARERDELEPNIQYHYTPFGHDRGGFVTFAMKMWKTAQERGDWTTYLTALKTFRLADYNGPEKDRCLLFLLQEGDWSKDREVRATDEEEVTAGIHFIHPLPMRAYKLLARHKDNKRAKEALGALSEILDDPYLDKAYCAEMWAAKPRAERLDRLTKQLIASRGATSFPNQVFVLFESMKDTGAMISWYNEHGASLYISNRYLTAANLSDLVEDDCIVHAVRQELIGHSLAVAKCDFESQHDETGMNMLRAYVMQQVPAQAWESREQHEKTALELFGLSRES